MYLAIFSLIVDIRPGSKYLSDERNKLFTFSKKVTLKATILGTCTCSTELLLWKNQKGSTRYTMVLYKRDSTADIFLRTSYFTKQLQTTDCKGYEFGALLTDLSKAFDCLPYNLLIAKLNAYGFDNNVLRFVYDYLTYRKQRTKISDTYSSWQEIFREYSKVQ